METSIIVKHISCILLWTILLTENGAREIISDKPKSESSTVTPTNHSTSPQIQNSNRTSGSISNGEKLRVQKVATDPNNNNTNSPWEAIKGASFVSVSKESQQAAALQGNTQVSMHKEDTPFKSSLWIYITIGILGVAFINFYVFWYRKRAATYAFVPKTTTQRR